MYGGNTDPRVGRSPRGRSAARRPELRPWLRGCIALLAVTGCSATPSAPPAGSGASGTGAGNSPGIGGATFASPGKGGGASDTRCGGDRYDAQPTPLDMYIMIDDSGSMVPWWLGVTQVFSQFINDPASGGIGVGVQFFGSNCDPNFYATPRVPIAPLPGNVPAIEANYPLIPVEGTATEPAMQGAIQHARAWQGMNPGHKVVVLLITDGLPSECNSTIASVSQVISEGFTGNPSIQTFVLGLGFTLNELNQLAQAGGTNTAFLVDPASAQALTDAMNEIRGAALPCDYALPNGGNVDPSKLNIDFTAADGATTTIPNVGDASGCDPAAGGWYYDNPGAPTRALVCPSTCGTFQAAELAQVNVVLGCDTVVR